MTITGSNLQAYGEELVNATIGGTFIEELKQANDTYVVVVAGV